ncbi:MAG: hypothetical protein V3R64_07095, partial [Sphingomonadales bacterium]
MEEKIAAPIFVVALEPTTIISPKEGENFSLKIEEIQIQIYDYLQFCRTTGVLERDIGHKCSLIWGHFSSFFFPAFPDVDSNYVKKVSNQICFELLLGGIYFRGVESQNIGKGIYYQTGYFQLMTTPKRGPATFLRSCQQMGVSSDDLMDFYKNQNIPFNNIKKAWDNGYPISKKLDGVNSTLL